MLRPRLLVAIFLATFASAAPTGCGDDDRPSDTSDVDGGPGEVDAGPGEIDAGPDEDDGGVDASTSAMVTLSDVAVYGNCMPVVAPDPVIAFWNASVTGASDDTATLTDAELTIGAATQTLTVDTPTIALTGGAGSQDQRKTDGDPVIEGACGSLCSDASYTLALTFAIDGASVVVTDTGAYGCVY